MGSKLFVGGLSWGTTDETMRTAFEAFGQVREARVILDRETGRSRGFGFVTFQDDASAAKAIAQMNGAMVDGRSIRVNEAEERRSGPGGGGGARRGGRNDRGPGPVVHTRGRPPRRDGPGGDGRGPGGPPGGGYRSGGGGAGGGYSGGGGYRGGSDSRRTDGRPPRRDDRGGGGGGYRGGSGGGDRGGDRGAAANPGDGDWGEDRSPRRDRSKKKRGPTREDEAARLKGSSPRRDRRESGRTWRDYTVPGEDDDDLGDDVDLDGASDEVQGDGDPTDSASDSEA